MAFPVNSGGGQINTGWGNPQIRNQQPGVPQQPNPTDGFTPTPQNQGTMPPPQPQGMRLNNGLSVQHLSNNGQMTGMYATLPGGPGGLLGAPIMISLSTAPAQNTLGATFTQAQAYEVGADGKVLRDDQNQPKTLKADVMPDGRVYVQTDKDNPSAPLVMLDPDGSYGIATPAQPKAPGDTQFNMGYTREQAEFVKPDGSRGWRVHEDVQASNQGSDNGMLTGMLTGGLSMLGGGAGREVTYTEVQQTQKGLESRDIHFKQAPGAPWPGFSQGNQWSKMLSMNQPDSRERSVTQEGPVIKAEGGWSAKRLGSLLMGKSGLGANTWTYGKQETVTFIPLSTQKMMQGQPGGPPPLPNTPPVMGGPPPQTPPPLPENF